MIRLQKNLLTKRDRLKELTIKNVLDFMMNNAIFIVLLGLLCAIILVSPDFVSLKILRISCHNHQLELLWH